jgi:small subunit ribosomal protein S6
VLREFETTFILQPEISDEGVRAVRERLDGILERHGATRLLYDDDGKRRLAYEIRHFQKGHYLTLHYFDGGKVVPEIERALRLDESVLRFLTVRVADEVGDVEERKRQAAEEEKVRAQRAAERAALEAQEAQEREVAGLGAPDEDEEESEDDEE